MKAGANDPILIVIRLAQEGDEQARAALIRRFEPMVRHRAWRGLGSAGTNGSVGLEDLSQEARVALNHAIDTYDLTKAILTGRHGRPTRFSTYAIACVMNRLTTIARKARREGIPERTQKLYDELYQARKFLRKMLVEEEPTAEQILANVRDTNLDPEDPQALVFVQAWLRGEVYYSNRVAGVEDPEDAEALGQDILGDLPEEGSSIDSRRYFSTGNLEQLLASWLPEPAGAWPTAREYEAAGYYIWGENLEEATAASVLSVEAIDRALWLMVPAPSYKAVGRLMKPTKSGNPVPGDRVRRNLEAAAVKLGTEVDGLPELAVRGLVLKMGGVPADLLTPAAVTGLTKLVRGEGLNR